MMQSSSLAAHLTRITDLFNGTDQSAASEVVPEDYGPLQPWVDALALSTLEVDLLLMALLPEVDETCCEVFQALQSGLGLRRPTIGLALARLRPDDDRLELRSTLAKSPLFSSGLLEMADGVPFFDRALSPAPALAGAFDGSVPWRLGPTQRVELMDDRGRDAALALNHVVPFAAQVDELLQWSQLTEHPTIVVDGGTSRAHRLALAIGQVSGCDVLRVEVDGAPDLTQAVLTAIAHDAVLLIELAGRHQSLAIPANLPWSRPLIIHGQFEHLQATTQVRRIVVPRPSPSDLCDLWEELLPADRSDDVDVDILGNRTHLQIGSIVSIVDLAKKSAQIEERPVDAALLERSIREVCGTPSSALATTREPLADLAQMVLADPCRQQLEEMVRRVRLRARIERQWHYVSVSRPGSVVGLFHGKPGTGKTLAAEALARRLSMPLMVVDVSQVTSKYIGETEERLDEVFTEAEGFRALLLLDEADAFFGTRTSLNNAHDRWANLQTNFLLQRLEDFEGIAVLASNMRRNIDDAFTRRFQFVVHFPEPNPAQRLQLFRAHLGEDALRDLSLEAIVTSTDLVGGEIRNVALNALYSAANRGTHIDQQILEDALRAELIKTGRRIPPLLKGE